jgi:hypothetical protein
MADTAVLDSLLGQITLIAVLATLGLALSLGDGVREHQKRRAARRRARGGRG